MIAMPCMIMWQTETVSYSLTMKIKLLTYLLVCRDVPELCRVLRPCLRLIRSRRPGELDYAQLLDDLLRFPFDPDKVKARWVMDFSHSVLGKKEQAAEEAEKGEAHE